MGKPFDRREALVIVAEFSARPGMEEALRDVTVPLAENARNEPDILLFLVNEDRERQGHFILYEVYASRSASEEHVAKPHVRRWFERLAELAADDVRVVRLGLLDALITPVDFGKERG